jgi:hypothetical protein
MRTLCLSAPSISFWPALPSSLLLGRRTLPTSLLSFFMDCLFLERLLPHQRLPQCYSSLPIIPVLTLMAHLHTNPEISNHFKVVMCITKVHPGRKNSDYSPKSWKFAAYRLLRRLTYVRQNVWEWHIMTRTDHVDPTSADLNLSKARSRIVTNRSCRSWSPELIPRTRLASQATPRT